MAPLRSTLKMMKRIVEKKGWSQNDLDLGRRLMLLDIYQASAERQY